jgi:hypothetical protein
MKTLRALMFASVCAVTTAEATSAPLLDVERSDMNVIVVGTPTAVRETAPTTTVADSPTTTTQAENAEVASTTAAGPTAGQDASGVLPAGQTP